ncbi:MAG: HlyD family type I secretion periplasmic adaptor subunit [Sphingosinicella sp.]
MENIENLTDRLRPRQASTILLYAIAGFIVLFVLWAAFAELERTVRGQGRVIPSSQLQIVSNLEGGVVGQILVRQGQLVRAGDPLIRLDPTQTGAEFGAGEATAMALQAKIARLQAEVEGRTPAYPNATSPVIADQIRIEQALHASRMADFASRNAAGQAQVTQATRAVSEAQANYRARVAAREARQAELRIIRPLVERGIEPRLSLSQAEAAAAVATSEAAAAAAAASRASAAVAEARSAYSQMRQEWRSQAANELATAQGELSARTRALPALAARLERTVVRAPVAGRVNRVLVTTRGGSVAPGAPLVEIVPSEDSLLVEAQIRPEDIAFVRLNQRSQVAITAYDRSIYGTLEGRVVNISPDAIVDEEQKQTFYVVRVRTSANALRDPRGNVAAIGPGMVAEVDLLGDTRTVLQYILSPITRLGETAFREQ